MTTPALTGANAWNESGNLLLATNSSSLILPLSMAASVAASYMDSGVSRLITIGMIVVLTLFLFYFFRNPIIDRSGYAGLGLYDMVAPASGTIEAIDKVPMEQVGRDYGPLVRYQNNIEGVLEAVSGKNAWRIAIYLSPFDPHVQCMPAQASVKSIAYRQGTFEPALLLEKSQYNERAVVQFLVPNSADGKPAPVGSFYVVLIAGLMARTISLFPNCRLGQQLDRGAKIGMIKFGSRVDLIIPDNYNIKCEVGQSVKLGQTLLATLGAVQFAPLPASHASTRR